MDEIIKNLSTFGTATLGFLFASAGMLLVVLTFVGTIQAIARASRGYFIRRYIARMLREARRDGQ